MAVERMIKPTFVGVGAMKSATTWISECLRYHPEVFVSEVKELHFFSRNWDKGSEWYFNQFKNVERETAIGEFSVSYMDDPEYAQRIVDLLGEVKILICVRNPIDRFISHYKHICRVDENAKLLDKNKIDINTFQNAIKHFPELLKKGVYSESIKLFQKLFGKDKVLVIFKNDIDEMPQKTVQHLFEFLNISKDFIPPIIDKTVSEGIVPQIKFLEKIRVKVYKILKKVYPRGIILIRKFRIAELYRKLNKSNQSFFVSPEVLSKLSIYYEKDITIMEELFDRDLNNWRLKIQHEKAI